MAETNEIRLLQLYMCICLWDLICVNPFSPCVYITSSIWTAKANMCATCASADKKKIERQQLNSSFEVFIGCLRYVDDGCCELVEETSVRTLEVETFETHECPGRDLCCEWEENDRITKRADRIMYSLQYIPRTCSNKKSGAQQSSFKAPPSHLN